MSTDWLNVSDTTPRIAYTATAAQTVFPVPFVFFADADLIVYRNGNALVLDTDYTVTGEEETSGGTVTLITGATVGDAIQIVREVAYEQTTHIPPSGPLDVPAINIQISKLVAMIQQVNNKIRRSFRLLDNVTLSEVVGSALPAAGEYLKYNANGNGIESTTVVTPAGSYGIATQSEAEAGTVNDVLMTPLRVHEAIEAQVGTSSLAQYGDGVTDGTTAFNAAIAAGNVIVPPGNYILTGDVLIPSNRFIWIQKGANIDIAGGRWTAYLPGGGNVEIFNQGDLYFHDTVTGGGLTGWYGGERGMIEMGGSMLAPAGNLRVHGSGRVHGDYVFTTIAATALDDVAFQINRKGIAFWNAFDVLVEGQEVDHIHGEAVYHGGGAPDNSYNVQFIGNDVHHCRFNGLNFNTFYSFEQMLIADNRIYNCFTGIESSTGTILNNHIRDVHTGIITGGGGGVFGIRIESNKIYGTIGYGMSIEFDPAGTTVTGAVIRGNTVAFAGSHGYVLSKIDGFQLKDNYCIGHATLSSGVSYAIGVTAVSGHLDGNCTKSPGAFSAGTFTNSGTACVVGTNPDI